MRWFLSHNIRSDTQHGASSSYDLTLFIQRQHLANIFLLQIRTEQVALRAALAVPAPTPPPQQTADPITTIKLTYNVYLVPTTCAAVTYTCAVAAVEPCAASRSAWNQNLVEQNLPLLGYLREFYSC